MISVANTIVFDLDGTLIHSAPDLQSAVNAALVSVGRQTLDLATVTSFIGNGVDTLVQRSLTRTGPWTEELQEQAMSRFKDSYAQDMTTLTRPYPGVLSVLDALKADGYRLGICTNKPDAAALQICGDLDLAGYFDVISGVRPGQPKKPEAAPLLNCIAAMGGSAETAIYVGDSGVDHATAANAGVAFRLFMGGYLNADPAAFADVPKFDVWSMQAILD